MSVVPPKPTVACQADWDLLSAEEKARVLYTWQNFWFQPAPACELSGSNPIVLPTARERRTSDGDGKQPPTREELESLHSDDWKRF